ncbi:unnamed protein product [Sympodiomycopsis kandeliae]
MFKPLGLLTDVIACPTHQKEKGSCDKYRSHCPFGHSDGKEVSKTSTVADNNATASTTPPAKVEETATTVPSAKVEEAKRGTQPLIKKAHSNNSYASGSKTTSAATATTSTSTQWHRAPVIPLSTHPSKSGITLSTRNTYLRTLWSEYTSCYSPLVHNRSISKISYLGRKLSFDHAQRQEVEVFKHASKASYKTSIVTVITGIRKRNTNDILDILDEEVQQDWSMEEIESYLMKHCTEIGINTEVDQKRKAKETRLKNRLQRDKLIELNYVTPVELLHKYGYDVPLPEQEDTESASRSSVVTQGESANHNSHDDGQSQIAATTSTSTTATHNANQAQNVATTAHDRLDQDQSQAASSSSTTSPSRAYTAMTLPSASIDTIWGPRNSASDFLGSKKICNRCSTPFTVTSSPSQHTCTYHWGKRRFIKDVQSRSRIQQWTCCNSNVDGTLLGGAPSLSELAGYGGRSRDQQEEKGDDILGCVQGPHVFKEEDVKVLHSLNGYVSTDELSSQSQDEEIKYPVIALDCEMAYTTAGMDIIRATLLDEKGDLIIDQMIHPTAEVIDTNTRFSGITPEQLSSAKATLPSVQTFQTETLSKYLTPSTILIGHGLENDLRAMRIIHPTVIDTAILFPHAKGLPFRNSLKLLSETHLKRSIQNITDTQIGHSSHEDSKAALDLVVYAVNKSMTSPFTQVSSGSQRRPSAVNATAGSSAQQATATANAAPTKSVLISNAKTLSSGTGVKRISSPAGPPARPTSSVLISNGQTRRSSATATSPPSSVSRPSSSPQTSTSTSLAFIPRKKPRQH